MSRLTISNRNLFFTADTHFGHKNAIQKIGRNYASVEEMNSGIINAWNTTVPKSGTVIHLGDFSFLSRTKSEEIFDQLNGSVILVNGNHDSDKLSNHLNFSLVVDYLELNIMDGSDRQQVICMHYPMATWNKAHYGAWHLHGHSHGNYQAKGRMLDVGWDVHNKPISYVEVKEYMSTREFFAVDHHKE